MKSLTTRKDQEQVTKSAEKEKRKAEDLKKDLGQEQAQCCAKTSRTVAGCHD